MTACVQMPIGNKTIQRIDFADLERCTGSAFADYASGHFTKHLPTHRIDSGRTAKPLIDGQQVTDG